MVQDVITVLTNTLSDKDRALVLQQQQQSIVDEKDRIYQYCHSYAFLIIPLLFAACYHASLKREQARLESMRADPMVLQTITGIYRKKYVSSQSSG